MIIVGLLPRQGFDLVWFICLTAYELLIGHLMPIFNFLRRFVHFFFFYDVFAVLGMTNYIQQQGH